MRNTFAKEIFSLSKKNDKIRVVAADISPAGKLAELSKKKNKIFINVGVAETSMISICAGLALSGYKPFAYTIATFSLYRPFEMVRDDLCYQNLPVTIVGMGSGTIYSTLGGTHMSQEDIGIARCLPNMQVIAPCDSIELKSSINFLVKKSKSPTYLRIGKSGEKDLIFHESEEWKFGKIRKIKNGKNICLIGYGPVMKLFFEILKPLGEAGIKPSIYSSHTLKPFDYNGLEKIFRKYKYIISLEDHSEINGLSKIILEHAFKKKFNGKIENFSLQDKFIKNYGVQNDLLKMHGISKKKLILKILDGIRN